MNILTGYNNSNLELYKPNEINKLELIDINLFKDSNNNSIINDVHNCSSLDRSESIEKTGVITDLGNKNDYNFYTKNPLISKTDIIKIPSKVIYTLERFTPKRLLKEIHPDLETSIELCLLFLSQLSSTYFEIAEGKAGWKALKAAYLRELFSFRPMAYKRIIEALEEPLKKGPIIECDHLHEKGKKCYNYRLSDEYISKGIVCHELRTSVVKRLKNKHYERLLASNAANPIIKNLKHFYSQITLPTIDEILVEAHRLISLNFHSKKGKKLIFQNKHPKKYFKHLESLSFVEDGIKIFDYLTEYGLMIPRVGSVASGGRIVDSFTLMPSWIRSMIKINGHPYCEIDYSCLHPNIAMAIYGGSQQFLTHASVAEELNIEVGIVKQQHLSFFNKEYWQMKESPLMNYYQSREPQMLGHIINEKNKSVVGHRKTSQRMFTKEVEIMTEAIKKLNSRGIFVGYVYDALFCEPDLASKVKVIMDETAKNLNVKTTAKVSFAKN